MNKQDTLEAMPIVIAATDTLLEWAPTQGRPGAILRTRAGVIKADAERLIQFDMLGPAITDMFDQAVEAGINLGQLENVRERVEVFQPVTVGAIIVKDSLIQLTLVSEGVVISRMEFDSKQDLEELQKMINESFEAAENAVADRMDAMTFQALIGLHAAISLYLIETARPRPRMVSFRFNQIMTTLTASYRLYDTAARADDIRDENRVIHPAFLRPEGRALAF
jgi:hypothetical protein